MDTVSYKKSNVQILEVHLIKDSGLSVASIERRKMSTSSVDLLAPLLTGIDIGAREALSSNIKYIVLENEAKLIFKRYTIKDFSFTVVVFFKCKNDDVIDVYKMIHELKMYLQEKNRHRVFGMNSFEGSTSVEIKSKMEEMFY